MNVRDKPEPEPLLTAIELATRINSTPGTVRSWARTGRIPSYRMGKKTVRFNFSEVMEAMRKAADR